MCEGTNHKSIHSLSLASRPASSLGEGAKGGTKDRLQKEVFPGFYQWPGKACYYVNKCRAKNTRVVEGLGPSMTRDRIVRQQVG